MVNVYLDEKKTPRDEKGFIIIKSITDLVSLLSKEKVDLLSLNHDLAESNLALNAVTYLIRKNIFIQYINFHNFSKTKSLLLKKRLQKQFPDIVITMNKYI